MAVGAQVTQHNSGWTRNRIDIVLGKWSIQILQSRDVVLGGAAKHRGHCVHSSDLVFKDVAPNGLTRALRVAEDIAWLLSLACNSPIDCFGHEYPAGSGRGITRTSVGKAQVFRPAFQLADGAAFGRYLELTWPAFRQLRRKRRLQVTIDYMVQAEREGTPGEVRLLLMFVALEGLKSTYAKSKGIRFSNGAYRGPRNEKLSFRRILSLMLADVGMRRGLKRLVDVRNQIVHAGVVRTSRRSVHTLYEDAHSLVREYLLRLLGYTGAFEDYKSMEVRVITPRKRRRP